MPTPLVIDLQMYLASNEARVALHRAQASEELLRPIQAPADLVRLLQRDGAADDVRDAVLVSLLSKRDQCMGKLSAAVLFLALRPSLRLLLVGIDAAHGDADNELALAILECLPAPGVSPPPYVEFRSQLSRKLAERRHGGWVEEPEPDFEMSASTEFGLPKSDPIYFTRAHQLLGELNPIELQILLGHAVLGETHAEVAKRVGVSLHAARTRHSRATRALARKLADTSGGTSSVNVAPSRPTPRRSPSSKPQPNRAARAGTVAASEVVAPPPVPAAPAGSHGGVRSTVAAP